MMGHISIADGKGTNRNDVKKLASDDAGNRELTRGLILLSLSLSHTLSFYLFIFNCLGSLWCIHGRHF